MTKTAKSPEKSGERKFSTGRVMVQLLRDCGAKSLEIEFLAPVLRDGQTDYYLWNQRKGPMSNKGQGRFQPESVKKSSELEYDTLTINKTISPGT